MHISQKKSNSFRYKSVKTFFQKCCFDTGFDTFVSCAFCALCYFVCFLCVNMHETCMQKNVTFQTFSENIFIVKNDGIFTKNKTWKTNAVNAFPASFQSINDITITLYIEHAWKRLETRLERMFSMFLICIFQRMQRQYNIWYFGVMKRHALGWKAHRPDTLVSCL